MRKVAILTVVAMLPLSMFTVGASARPSSNRTAAPPLTPVESDALTTALENGRLSAAEYALERARSLFRIGSVRREFGSVERPDPHAATFIMRDLNFRLDSLSGEEREQAERILARPTQGNNDPHGFGYSTSEASPTCTANACVHYVTTTSDAANPAYVAAASSAVEEVWGAEVTAFGWKAPKSDMAASHNGGDARFDVYLKDLGAGFYGFCTGDVGQSSYSQYAYCVVDNDFAASQFPGTLDSVSLLKATLAHEFNHAIQFGYDASEDIWWLENIATWMEDEVYDTINDNYNYVEASPLSLPQTPADTFKDYSNPSDPASGFQYGGFIWMKYFAEKFGTRDVIREMFERADATTSGANSLYSLEAITDELEQRGTDFPSSFVDFAARNTDPSLFYEEGAAYETKYTMPVRQASHTLAGGAAPVSGQFTNADHLSSRFVSLKPGSGIGSTEQISIAVNMGTAPGQAAAVVNIANNAMTVTEIPLTNGEGSATVAFGGQNEVVLVLSNASTRMSSCGSGAFSCSGRPVDDNLGHNWAAALGTTAPDPGDPTGGGGDTDAPVVSGLSASPTSFKANGRNSTVIEFSISEAAVVNLKIINSSGKKVFGLTDRSNVDGPGTYGLRWFGTNSAGTKLVKAGKYRIKIKGTDAAGNVGQTRTTRVTVRR